MAINVNTGDGNNVDWDNTDFWQSGSSVGEMSKKWTNDFKDATQFKKPASNYIAVIHENGVIKAWREFTAKDSTKSLFDLLSATDSEASYAKSGATCKSQITESVISESGLSKILKTDSIIRGTGDNLYANCNNDAVSAGADLNRISAKTSATEFSYDKGWGLGTKYDAELTHIGPGCDAMMDGTRGWGNFKEGLAGSFVAVAKKDRTGKYWEGGPGSIVGKDCAQGVGKAQGGWNNESGEKFDYAIFVA